MTPHQELTFMPRLTHEYELTDSDILPKDYATFLVECAQIYVNQSYPDLKKDDEFFQPNFNLVGQIQYIYPDDQSEQWPRGITRRPAYHEDMGIAQQLNANHQDFAVTVQDRVQQINTQLDQRFPQREQKFPSTYITELDLSPNNLEIFTMMKYDALGREMYISLKTAGNQMQDRSKKYHSIRIPTLAITLSDDCTAYATLESMMDHLEHTLKQHYEFERRKTITEYIERSTVELAEKIKHAA